MNKRSTKTASYQTCLVGLTMLLDFSRETFEINSLLSNEMDIARTVHSYVRNVILAIVKPGGRIKSEIESFHPMRLAATVL